MNVSMEFKMSANISEPSPRRDHFSAPVEDKLYVWGGTGGLEKSVVTSIVHHYDPDSETWNNNTCEGPHPPGIREGACASTDHHLYTYGGFNEQMDVQGTLHLLDTRSRRWKLISSEGGPMKKTGCRMVIYDSKIVLFGGYGEPSGPIQPGAQFDKVTGTGSSGWTNELHTFNLKEGTWSSPTVTGTRPPPCSYFSLTMVDEHRGVLFGGSGVLFGGTQSDSDVYMLDLSRMHWSKLDIQGESCPKGRYDHAAVCLGYGGDHPQLLVTGGWGSANDVLSDVWLLDVQSGRWRKVIVPTLQSRHSHSAGAFSSLSPGLTEVIIFGGHTGQSFIAETTVLRFEYQQCSSPGGPLTGEWVLTDVADNTQLGTEERIRNKGYLIAYRQILATHDTIEMWFIKIILLGAPCLGKSTVRRRLAGEIDDISSSGETMYPSTGAVESGVVIRNLSSTTALVTPSEWSFTKDLAEEASLMLHCFFSYISDKKGAVAEISSAPESELTEGNTPSPQPEPTVSPKETPIPDSTKVASKPSVRSAEVESSPRSKASNSSQYKAMILEVVKLFGTAGSPKYWKDIKHLFKDTAFIKMEDTGGQPEFMDMLAALTIGPALYLLFCKLIDDLQSHYTVSYRSPSGESSTPVQSTYTVEEVLLSALASVSCFKSTSQVGSEETTSTREGELLASSNKSLAYILGTHKDLVSEQEIAEFDRKLQESIRSTDFYKEGLVQFSSEDRMVLPIDNMHGGKDEIGKVRRFLEEGMKRHFKKLSIPAAWLILSLCLRKREERTASLQSVLQLAGDLGMSEQETKSALWFLHHHAGVLMYFPNLAELKDTVICDTQVVYDSATNLIVDTFRFGQVCRAASERFRKTGQFSLEDIGKATASVSGDYIPLLKLVKLLEHLNIIAPIARTESTSSPASTTQSSKVAYFMPCVLQNAPREELDKWWETTSSPLSPAPLFIRYECGFSLIGIFPAMIANLVGNKALQLIVKGIKKNRVQFTILSGDYDTFTLIFQPKYYAVHITREPDAETPTHEVCSAVRGMVESTLKTVTSHMNYSFCAEYQLSFECPSHPGRDHLCTVARDEASPRFMLCQMESDYPRPVKMQSQHLAWFGKPLLPDVSVPGTSPQVSPGTPCYVATLPANARPHLELQLDWGHGGVEKDLCEIAHVMLDWEERLSTHLGLTEVDVHDIKAMHSGNPPLQRKEALRRWQSKQGLRATYWNLLALFVQAGHTQCAEVLCEMLRKKYPCAPKPKYQ